jgi:hypothetical protein
MQNFDHNIGFREKRQFFAKNWQKSQKIVIIASTPDLVAESGKFATIKAITLTFSFCRQL